ncbi:uncharacterized protein LOC142357015 [Convolutriloba macropyga]|uniref:uncharacterized protein LOC142357015 n=1 Tax=Convolutriloba macropyga TaxID=536237 RepID=UPI003F528513
MQAGILNADGSLSDTGSTLPTGRVSVVSAIVHGMSPLGCAAWQSAADLLLKPGLPWPVGSLPRSSEEAMWQIFFQGLEASHSVPPLSALWEGRSAEADLVQMYLTRVIVHKRSLARSRNSAAPHRRNQQPKLPTSMLAVPPPPALCKWLRSQPLNQTVSAALAVLDQQTQDLTGHLLLRTQDKEVTTLLKLWQVSRAAELAGPDADDGVRCEESAQCRSGAGRGRSGRRHTLFRGH